MNLMKTTDAAIWAREFMKVVESGAVIDESFMISWFANMWAATNDPLQAKVEELEAKVAELTKPVPPAEEGEFTSCAEMLDDWFGSCNIQGTAQMETVEVEELVEEMRLIERRKNQICVHGKGLTDYCEPCGRIHGG